MKSLILIFLLIGCSSSPLNIREEKCSRFNNDLKECHLSYCKNNPSIFACGCWVKNMRVSSSCRECIEGVDDETSCKIYEAFGDHIEDYDGFSCENIMEEVSGVCK